MTVPCRWHEDKRHFFTNICDAEFRYNYVYLGNMARLVITPLTDRSVQSEVATAGNPPDQFLIACSLGRLYMYMNLSSRDQMYKVNIPTCMCFCLCFCLFVSMF